MKILDIVPMSEFSFMLKAKTPKYRNLRQKADTTLTVPYPYFEENVKPNCNKDMYVIPYIEKYFHNMLEIWPNILYLKKMSIDFTLIVVCDNPEDYDEKTKMPYGWEDNGSVNMSCFKKLLDDHRIKYQCFHRNSKEYLEMIPKSGIFFYNNKNIISFKSLTMSYPREMYFTGHYPEEPCVSHSTESLLSKFKILKDWAPKYVKKKNKIYISRKNFSDRAIKNEDYLIEYLEGKGYKTIFFEDYSILEQIRIVQESSHIIVQSGSSLLNCALANPGTKIFEIRTNPYEVGLYEVVFKMYNIDWKMKKFAGPDGKFIVRKLEQDQEFLNAFVAQRTEQDSSKVLAAGSTPAEGAK